MSHRRLRRWAALALAPAVLVAGCGGPDTSPGVEPSSPNAGTADPAGLPAVLADAVRRGPERAPARATSPDQVAAQLAAAVTALEDRAAGPGVVEAAAHLEQVAYRVLGRHPEWDSAVRDLLPAELWARVADNAASRREFIALQGGFRSDSLPAWSIVAPEPLDDLVSYYLEAQERFGVDWEYLAAINLVETGMGRIVGNSVAGAQGPMQFIPETWARYGLGGDVTDPRDAILGAGNYLASRGFAERGGKPDALYSYNNDVRYVRGVTRIAEVLQRDPRAYLGYYHWQIYYVSTAGEIRLPRGYDQEESVPVGRYLAANPRA